MMISSSPEFAITKPGMPPPHLLRKRDKPLRTYSRKCASAAPEPRDEPPAKKARSGFPDVHSPPSTRLVVLIPAAPAAAFERDTLSFPDGGEAPRSSILDYFRPLPAEARPPSQKPRSADKQTDSAANNGDATPCVRERGRTPRLLKIGSPPLRSETPSNDARGLSGRDDDGADGNASSSSDRIAKGGTAPSGQTGGTRDRVFHKDRNKHRGRPARRARAVQTTLNISSRAPFAECRVCDTVWNPLYPDDVRFHERRHKALLRRERKREAEKL
ncbi:hypothetical protein E4U42_007424 [Claviceps africana]|uniref:N-acetyltransferase ESCO zinc-finger domain-containing protein n=1 Tax=Claviceps africana TaxID=83212 RepID=A0A8K0NG72_9HYPO|nr:hypothetical protein E4U42_007424 [Claviceps africana]